MSYVSKIKLPDNSVLDIKDSRIAGIDSAPTSESTNVVTSGGVYTALSGVSMESMTNSEIDSAVNTAWV